MGKRVIVCVGLMLVAAGPLMAADAKTGDPKAEAAESAAAMERARKMAASPLKVILEASKLRRKIVGGDGDVVVTAAAPAAAATASPLTSQPPAQPTGALIAMGTRLADAADVQPGLPLSPAASPLVSVASLAAVGDLPALAAAKPTTTPKLREMVEPVIPPRVLDEVGKLGAIQADLLIRADGSVAQVTLVQPVPRQLARYVVDAMERWRFDPLAVEVRHRVQLVFNDER